MAQNGNSTMMTEKDPLSRTKVQIGFEVFFAVVICLGSILGNALVVFVVNKDSRLKSITNIFIHNLAWTDIFIASFHMPFWVISLYTGRWMFSLTLCQWVAAMHFTFGVASILNMGVIALNRYLKVVKPGLYPKFFPGKRIARLYCLGVWLAAILFATPPLYGWGAMDYHPAFAVCSLVWEIKHISYAVFIVGVSVNGATIAIFYSYYKIYRSVKASSATLISHAAENTANLNSRSHSTDNKLLKATFTVVCVFVACWAPVSLVVLCETIFGPPPRLVNTVVVYLMLSSSGVNPVIYGLMNPQFKRAFVKVLKCNKSDETRDASLVILPAQASSSGIPAPSDAPTAESRNIPLPKADLT